MNEPVEEPLEPTVASSEELREIILAQHRRLANLDSRLKDATHLLRAMQVLLEIDSERDPFVEVFEILAPLYNYSDAILLAEPEPADIKEDNTEERSTDEAVRATGEALVTEDETAVDYLRCAVSTIPQLEGSKWPISRFLNKVLHGRPIATVPQSGRSSWPQVAGSMGLSADQPALYLPVNVRSRRGLLMLLRPEGDVGFDRRDLALASKWSLLASQAFAARLAETNEAERQRLFDLTEELRRTQSELARRAFSDQLTGLANRSSFEEAVTKLLETVDPDCPIALAFIDLDGFKLVNDHYGHEMGDELLAAMAARLRSHVRPADLLARISGDEFVMVFNPVSDKEELTSISDRLLESLNQPFQIGGHRLMVSASIGLALCPEHGVTYGELLRNADIAMYSAKNRSRGRAELFSHTIRDEATGRILKEQDLRRAIVEDRFCCVLQPKVSVPGIEIIGFEALARQVDHDGSVGTTADFVDLAAQLGLLDQITELVLADVNRSLERMISVFGEHISLSINLSTRQATDPELLRTFLGRLAERGKQQHFIVEVTEDAWMVEQLFTEEILPLLSRFGVRVSIDDFGSGYASLSRLLNMTTDEVKIDKAFITGLHERPRSQIIVRAFATATHDLGIETVAEGVESIDELRYLVQHTDISAAQGYLFERPLTVEDLISSQAALEQRLESLRDALRRT